MLIFFSSFSGCWVFNYFWNFSQNKSCQTYLGPMLPPGSRNLQLIPPYLDQNKVMVETLPFADLCNRVTIPLSEELLFSQLVMLITTHRMELLSLMTSALRPSFPRPSYSQDLIILIRSAATIELMLLTSKTFFCFLIKFSSSFDGNAIFWSRWFICPLHNLDGINFL